MKIQPIRGTHDIFGTELKKFNFIKKIVDNSAADLGFNEIITPIFESSDLFKKPLGEHSDVVLKEMYTFQDKNDSSLTLRPEYTTPIIRAAISNNLLIKLPAKLYGLGPMFRRERPQKGRYRQFHQMNFEIFGTEDVFADAELIFLANKILDSIIPNNQFKLFINSLGDRDTLKKFKSELSSYFEQYISDISLENKEKIKTNPIRILDSKNSKDIEISKEAPNISDFYSKNSKAKFEEVKQLLNNLNIPYEIDVNLVRGLDYYCDTVFEFKNENLGSQNTLIGGGRYDGLIKVIGGADIPGVGWAGGIERLMLSVDKIKNNLSKIHLIIVEESLKEYSLRLLKDLNKNNVSVYCDYRYNLKKALSFASEQKARFAIILGQEELDQKKYTLKDLLDSSQKMLSYEELLKKINLWEILKIN